MQDFIYHVTLKSHLIRDFRIKTSIFGHKKRDVFMDVNTCYQVVCIFNPLVYYSF